MTQIAARQPVSIAGIEFDALIEESRKLESDVPEYPVENGFVVTDGIILRPETLEMVLYLTNLPVTWKERFGGSHDRVSDVINRLEELYVSREPVTIITSDKVYTDMAIVSMSLTKTRETGRAREISISFQKIRVTSQKTTTIPASYGKSGTSGINAGTTGTTAKNEGEKKGSILYNLASSTGLLGGG